MKYTLVILIYFYATPLFAQVDETQHILFKEIKTKYQVDISNNCDTFKVYFNDTETASRVSFLNKDFSTTLFSNNSSVEYWFCNANDIDNKRMHLGIISIVFKSEKEREAVLKKIISVGRTNFKTKLLTKFKVKYSKRELVIFFTETVRNKSTSAFWEKM
jgi:hypothetical protein